MSKKHGHPAKGGDAASPPVLTAPLTSAELDKSWRELAGLLKDQETADVSHAAVSTLAEKIYASSVLSGAPDGDALEILTTSLLQQSKWSSVVARGPFDSNLVASNPQLAFHFAYALYRDKQHAKALDELKKRGANLTEGELHLQAQAYYRAGNYSGSAKVYRETSLSQDDDVELQANMLAALVSAGLFDEAKAYIKKLNVLTNPPSFELAYNASCCFIESGDFATGLQVLRKAQKLCREILEEDELSPAEIENELAVLLVQEAFILQSLSKSPDADGTENTRALEIYTKVLTQHPTDPNVLSIASNNVITLRTGAGHIWDSLKKSSKAIENLDLKDMTLSTRQKSAIQLNRALALYHGKQNDKCKDVLSGLLKEFPNNVHTALAMAAVLVRDKTKQKEAEDLLNSWLKNNEASAPVESVQAAYLGLAHLALLKGDATAAATILVNLSKSKSGSDLANRPAFVATLVALYERANDIPAAHATIQAGIQYWKSAVASKKGDVSASTRIYQLLLSSAGAWYNQHGREADAAALLELLADQTTSSSSVNASARGESLARLVLAYRGDETKAAKFVAQLPPLQGVAGIDVKALETAPAPEVNKRKQKKKPAAAATSASAPAVSVTDDEGDDTDGEGGEEEKTTTEAATSASLAKAAARKALNAKRKRKHVPRYPKNYDPANPGPLPDPERWLPRWERSNQKKFAKRRQQGNAIRGAQGSTNMANMPAAAKEESTSVESKGQMSGAAAAAARKRAGKKR